jgi:uncharacterized repeat protein (TIGR03803 family)
MKSTTRAILTLIVALASGALAEGQEQVLHAFTGHADGRWPYASLIFDQAGHLYGTTYSGGPNGSGEVFKLVHSKGVWKETVIYGFKQAAIHGFIDNNVDGAGPYAPVIFDKAGNLYGTTSFRGAYNQGTVFELKHSTGAWRETVLHSLDGVDGAGPYAPVIFDEAGNLYGTAVAGGASGRGTVFELTRSKNGWKGKPLYSFTGNTDGGFPYAGLVMDKSGNLYGTTQVGGQGGCGTGDGCGVLFKLTHSTAGWTETVLHTFCSGSSCSDGGFPVAQLIFDKAGNLYGTTQYGGAFISCGATNGGCGTVFELTPNSDGSWTETVLYAFLGGSDGGIPVGGVLFDKAGNLYGTTSMGGGSKQCGSAGCGTIFELTPSSGGGWSETVLYSFCLHSTNCDDGAEPQAGLILDPAGNLYGTTIYGGGSAGVAFKFTP